MNKSELISAVAEKTELSKKDTAGVLSALNEVIKETLAKGEKIALVGFGTFSVKERAARTGRNPRTGEVIEIAASKAPIFAAGKLLKEAVKPKDPPKKAKGKKSCKKK